MNDYDEGPHVQEAINTVAQHIAWVMFDIEQVQWEDYPELGELDFERVLEALEKLSPEAPLDYRESYEYLASRAVQS